MNAPASTPPVPRIPIVRRPARRRWLRRTIGGVCFVIVLALVSAGIWLARFQPLGVGSIGWNTPSVPAKVLPQNWQGITSGARIFRIPMTHPDLTFTYRFSISNDSPVPITVTAIGSSASDQEASQLTRVPVRMQLNVLDPTSTETHWEPFGSFDLDPHREAAIEMRATVQRCLASESAVDWGTEPVTFKVLGITRHVDFQPNVQIDLVGSPTCHN
jgi:hypothetical protein